MEEKKRKVEQSQEEAKLLSIQAQVDAAVQRGGFQVPVYTDQIRNGGDKLVLDCKFNRTTVLDPTEFLVGRADAATSSENIFKTFQKQIAKEKREIKDKQELKRKVSSQMELLVLEHEAKKSSILKNIKVECKNLKLNNVSESFKPPTHKYYQADWWVCENLIVKIMDKIVGDGIYYKQKGVILRVEERYIASVKILESSDVLRIDQSSLETVIPCIGGCIRVVLGEWRGHEGKLVAADFDAGNCSVRLHKGPIFKHYENLSLTQGVKADALPYDYICKINV